MTTPSQPVSCDSCHYATAALRRYDDRIAGRMNPNKRTAWFCSLCANTYAGNAWRWPEQYRESGNIMRTICYVGNVVLDAIREAQEGHDPEAQG